MPSRSPSNVGRPPGPTPNHITIISQQVRLGMSLVLAAGAAGISHSTLYRWLSIGETATEGNYRELWKAVKEAEARNAAGHMASVIQASKAGQWQASAWVLERRHGYVKPRAPVVIEDKRKKKDRLSEWTEMAKKTGLLEE